MDWQEIGVEPADNIYRFLKAGDYIEGLLKSASITGLNNKVYTVQKSDGIDVIFYGTTVLNHKLSEVAIGERVKIIYKGETKGKKGQLYKDYAVFKMGVQKEEIVK